MDFLIKGDVLVRYTRKYADPEIVVPEGIREKQIRHFPR